MKNLLQPPYQIVLVRQYNTVRPQKFLFQVSTQEPRAENILINFYKKSISHIDDALKSTQQKYPQMFTV